MLGCDHWFAADSGLGVGLHATETMQLALLHMYCSQLLVLAGCNGRETITDLTLDQFPD
jgi:hypothetical protein